MEVEDVTRISLTTWGAAEQQGHLTIGDGLDNRGGRRDRERDFNFNEVV